MSELVEKVARASQSFSVCEMLDVPGGKNYAVMPRDKWLRRDAVFLASSYAEAYDHVAALNARAAISVVLEEAAKCAEAQGGYLPRVEDRAVVCRGIATDIRNLTRTALDADTGV